MGAVGAFPSGGSPAARRTGGTSRRRAASAMATAAGRAPRCVCAANDAASTASGSAPRLPAATAANDTSATPKGRTATLGFQAEKIQAGPRHDRNIAITMAPARSAAHPAVASQSAQHERDGDDVDEGRREEDARETLAGEDVERHARVEIRGAGVVEAEARVRAEELPALRGQPRVQLQGRVVAGGGEIRLQPAAGQGGAEKEQRRGRAR